MLKTCYFVCLSILLITTGLVRCDNDFVFDFEADGWLKLHSEPATWSEALLKCLNEGSVLASPLNPGLAKALRIQMAQLQGSDIYLGVHDFNSKGLFGSVEGVPLSAMGIKLGLKDAAKDCITMSADGSTSYSTCTNPLPFVCYKKNENQTLNECDYEYEYNEQMGRCYKVHVREQTWSRAYELCAYEGGHLVILNDEAEANLIKSMFPAKEGKQFHIGLRAWGAERIWTTIHGESINDVFNHWNTNQPDNWLGNQERATFLRNGKMDDVQPWTVAMFVCEKSPK
ncbi:hypothetical protein PYW07_017448 [Mythimna separata]|uniref:C-type lectin domain-containing protein n=1 Tax=Mythimna separata TaxID=271217 RepID=A0AAD7YYL5_MYTSE|nr:hypothetical protein PYW07_017448 [Mythimna separata]